MAARHLVHYGYKPTIYYPKPGKAELYGRLTQQLRDLGVPFAPSTTDDFARALRSTDQVVDAVFGFSFAGEVREPFRAVIAGLRDASVPVLSVDAPSGWDVEHGPPAEGPASGFVPDALISLTAPKPLVRKFKGRHFIGGR